MSRKSPALNIASEVQSPKSKVGWLAGGRWTMDDRTMGLAASIVHRPIVPSSFSSVSAGCRPWRQLLTYWTVSIYLLLSVWILSACTAPSSTSSTPTSAPATIMKPTAMPTPHLRATVRMTGLAVGRIVYENGCLRLIESPSTTRTLVWPSDIALDVDLKVGKVTVLNPDGSKIQVTLGSDVVAVGGGGVGFPEANQRDVIDQESGTELCPPPYWLVAKVRLYPTPTP